MLPTFKFLHSMRERASLESAITNGLELRDHDVHFAPAKDQSQWQELIADVLPFLEARLESIGAPWSKLPEERRMTIMSGIGSIRGKIPMLCFTEIPEGRDIFFHQFSFGAYGVVVHRNWLESHGGDRVIYIGDKSPVSRNLFRVLANLQIASLFRDTTGTVLFNNLTFRSILDLFSYVEVRENLQEFEWRITGQHGFMGGQRETGKRLILPMEQVEMVLVQDSDDVEPIENLVKLIGNSQSATRLPRVLVQPEVLHDA